MMNARLLFGCLLLSSLLRAQSYATLPFEDDFFEAEWSDAWTARPDTALLGTIYLRNQHAYLGKTRDGGGFAKNQLDLHLNLENQEDVYFSFDIYDFDDETHEEDGLFLSDDGGATFTQVYNFRGNDYCGSAWGNFPPFYLDRLAEDAGLQLTSRFIIRIQQYGESDFNAGYRNARDGYAIDNVKVYSEPRTFANLPFSDDFDDGTAELGSSWLWSAVDDSVDGLEGMNKPTGFLSVQDNYGTDGTYGVRMTKRCDDGYSANALDLLLDLEGQSDVYLSFKYYDLDGEDEKQDGLFFSNDGGRTFTQVYTFLPESYCKTWGNFPPLSVDDLAAAAGIAFTDKFVIRFQQYDNADSNGGYRNDADGLYLDDVNVYSQPPAYASLPFEDNFDDGTGEFSQYWRWAAADATVAPIEGTTKPTGYVGIDNNYGTDGTFGVRMTKRCDDGYTANALDLHLNLGDKSDVYLSFDIYDRADNNEAQDGLYISNDGGDNFHRVFDLIPEEWCDSRFGRFPPLNLTEAARSVGITLTDKFIVRFQQYGDSDFSSGYRNDADGFVIDNVEVYNRPPQYATLPFLETFDEGTGEMPENFRVLHADSTMLPLVNMVKPSSYADIRLDGGMDNTGALAIGKSCDDGFSASAVDLQLNLAGVQGATLAFYLQDVAEEEQPIQEGLFYSSNGGRSFTNLYQFRFSEQPDRVWQKYTFNLDSLVAATGESFTDQSIIRFQQYDDADFSSGYRNDADGIILDSISITADSIISSLHPAAAFSPHLQIYPNPTDGRITLTSSEIGSEPVSVIITDARGRKVLQYDGVRALSSGFALALPAARHQGMYFVTVRGKRFAVVRRVMVH